MEEPRQHRCTTIVYYAWRIFTCLFTHVMLVTAVVAYCILGAIAFEKLECEHEIQVKKNVTYTRRNVTLENLWKLTQESDVLHQDNWTRDAMGFLREFENELVVAMKVKGWDGSDDINSLQWTFHGALFYSIIVITTIGYGHISPKTDFGKVATIFYAIAGIPLMLLCLSNIGDIMANSFRFLYWRICCYACTQPPKRHHSAHRRARSLRSTVRTHGSSGRSRTSSLRKQGSQRSADSALALSDTPTHSYSDTECRYYDDSEDRVSRKRGSSHKRQQQPLPPPSGRARHSETRATASDWDNKHMQQAPLKNSHAPLAEEGQNTPVLFNKYALDREESCRVHGQVVPLVPRSRSREVRAQTAEPEDRRRYLTVGTPPQPQRSSSLRQTYPGRRGYGGSEYSGGGGGSVRGRSHYDYYDDYYSEPGYTEDANANKPVPIWLCMFLVISYIIGGAYLFNGWEPWSFADSAYFCFITLTTIGFGDFVPAQKADRNDAAISIALCSLYLLFGIALLAMSFNLVQEEVISNVKSVARNLGIIKDESDDDDDY